MLCSCAAARPARPHHQPRQQHWPPHRRRARHSHEALQLRGGTATDERGNQRNTRHDTYISQKKKHAYITPRELTQIMVADLAPHGMLPLAWAATRGAGDGRRARRVALGGLRVVFCVYACIWLLSSRRPAGRRDGPAGSLSELWRGRNYPCQRPWTPWSRCYVAGVACFMRPLLRTCSTLWRSASGLGTSQRNGARRADLYTTRTIVSRRRPERAQVLVARRVAGHRLYGVVHW